MAAPSPGTSAERVPWLEPATSGARQSTAWLIQLLPAKPTPTRDSQRAASRPPHLHRPLAISEISCPVLQLLRTDQPCPASLIPSERLSEAGRSYRIAHSSNGPRPFHREADWQPAECLRRRSQVARRADLHQRPNTFAQTCLLTHACPLQSRGGPYNIGTNRGSRDDSFGLHNQASFTPAVRMPFSVKAGRGSIRRLLGASAKTNGGKSGVRSRGQHHLGVQFFGDQLVQQRWVGLAL